MDAMSTWSLSTKVFLISAGALSVAMAIKSSVDEFPVICSIILPWMKPPYLLVVINAIIITIVATSRFTRNQPEPWAVRSVRLISVKTPPPADFASLTAHPQVSASASAELVVYEGGDRVVELRPVIVNGSKVDIGTEEEAAAYSGADTGATEMVTDDYAEPEAEGTFVDWALTYDDLPKEKSSPEFQLEYYNPSPAREEPLISSSFPHRNPIRTSTPEGVAELREEAGQETLESTWKRITEGRRELAAEHLNKSDTWWQRLQKSGTFKDRANDHESPPGPASPGILKEVSPGRDELNRRVEEFIKNFNEEMRLQRLESLNKRVLSRGA